MHEPKIDMIELWSERTCGAQDTLNVIYNTCGPSIRLRNTYRDAYRGLNIGYTY